MKKFLYIVIMTAWLPLTADGQAIDPARFASYIWYDNQTRHLIETQTAILGAQMVQHNWIAGNEEDIYDLKKELDDYLRKKQNDLALAAQVYGTYNEIVALVDNLKRLSNVCSENPTNVLANAFSENKRKTVQDIVMSTTQLALDIRRILSEKSRMTEKERLELMDVTRKKLREWNKRLRMLERNIRYYNICDLWHELTGEKTFRNRTKKEIAEQAMKDWRSHYSFK